MADYRRWKVPGGRFFFTLVTERRTPFLCTPPSRALLHEAMAHSRTVRPFVLEAMVLLPEHLHAIWTLPEGDDDYSTRWAAIKAIFTRQWVMIGGDERRRTGSRVAARRRGVWQRRFWEHRIQDDADFAAHMDYVHYNPVKHGLARCPHEWPYSTFAKWVEDGAYERRWLCACDGTPAMPAHFHQTQARIGRTGE